ncbi:unnamed protein product [Medioppia subpectinata]|uniref:WH2 domain-containing protein n=1 Tax=Medioppia subpectinata TaxID=1979941 RepID=A0A7R9L587_9ACAR|nr:unnamed protein product [Medioppia subpectinata]CAG2115531.1 unnamed protein product [Medioppia subpectinata]
MSMLSMPLPPPSPFQNSNHEENSSLHDCNEGQPIDECCYEISDNFKDKHISSEQLIERLESLQTKNETNGETIETSDGHKERESETTSRLVVSDEESLDKEIEVTLQSLNDELDRLDSVDHIESQLSADEHSLHSHRIDLNNGLQTNDSDNANDCNNSVVRETKDAINNATKNISVVVKQITGNNSDVEATKSQLESRQSPAPSPTPRVISLDNKSKSILSDKSDAELKVSANGKTTVFINKSQTSVTPPPFSSLPSSSASSSISMSPSPTNEDKLSITDEVRQSCRPRVRLTNFSIGSYKKEVDIFEDTHKISRSGAPTTAPPLKSGSKSIVTFPSAKKEEKMRPSINQNKSKVSITSTSTTVSTPAVPKPSTPVIQTLITSAPKISRIQSWSGQKNVVFDDKNIKQPLKTTERYVSQIAINKDVSVSPTPSKKSNEDLRSPQLVVQSLIAKTEGRLNNRSPSPKLMPPKAEPMNESKVEPMKERTTISIKPGSQSVIRGVNTKIFHTKGWNSVKAVGSGEVPKVKHVDPPNQANVRDQLLNDIKNFGGKNTLKKVSKNTSWKLEVNTVKT